MNIRCFRNDDSAELSEVIAETLRTTNKNDYTPKEIDSCIASMCGEKLIERASWTHMYVVCDEDRIVGCGAIGPYWDKEDESCLFTIFVLPEYQGKGVGRSIIGTLERDELFLRAKRIEIPASITAVGFYRKMGYGFKDGVTEPDAEKIVRMEKFR